MISLPVKGAGQAQAYVAELVEEGLVVGEDFRWAYVPSQYDGWDDSTYTQPHVDIWIFKESIEGFYKLKWL